MSPHADPKPKPLPLDAEHHVLVGHLPPTLIPDADGFEALWRLHPADRHMVFVHGRPVELPRWQQAYGVDYRFSGQLSEAAPVPPLLDPYLDWARAALDPRHNSLLLNWYDAAERHYIGKHRDSDIDRVPGTDIVTVSLGEQRVMRLRPYRAAGKVDIPVPDGAVVIIPWATNRAWTHEVPHFARYRGRRISITLRAFDVDPAARAQGA